MTVRPQHTEPAADGLTKHHATGLVLHLRSAGCRMMLACALGMSSLSVDMAQAADIQPQDGQWRSRISVATVSGCAPEMRAEIEGDAIANAGTSRFIAFSQSLRYQNALSDRPGTKGCWKMRWDGSRGGSSDRTGQCANSTG
jgi:hypothetical protein